MRRLLLAFLLFAAPALGQEKFSATETVYSGGNTKITRFGFSSGTGTNSAGAARFGFPAGTVALYQLGNAKETIRGGYDCTPAANNEHFARTAGDIPCASGGTPQYPISMVCWFKATTIVASSGLVGLDDNAGATHRMGVTLSGSFGGTVSAYSQEGGTSGTAEIGASTTTANRWHCVIAVFTSASSRAVYIDTNPTGATNSTTVNVGSVSAVHCPGDGATVWASLNGSVAYAAVLPVAFSADQRTAIFAGSDPVRVAGFSYGSLTRTSDGAKGAVWKLDNDSGVDAGSNALSLTATNTPSAASYLLVVRDLSGGGRPVKATTAAPTYSTSIGNGQGGGVFASASSQYLVCSTVPFTAPPFQMYAVAQSDDVTTRRDPLSIADSGTTNNYWDLVFRGDFGGDPSSYWIQAGGSASSVEVAGYSANTNYLLWARETSSTNRDHGRNGSTTNNTTTRTASGIDRITVGCNGGSTPTNFLDGEVHFVLLLNNSSTTDQTSIETFCNSAHALGFTP